MDMNICFAINSDGNNLWKLLPVIYSIQKYTQKTSKLNFHIITNNLVSTGQFKNTLLKLSDQRTTFNILSGTKYVQLINPNHNDLHTFFAYMKLFIPIMFPNLDRMLYLDYDTIVAQEGLEELYNVNFDNNYIAAAEDISCVNNGAFILFYPMHTQQRIFKYITNYYINSGVMVFNIKKILKDHKDIEIFQYLKNEPFTSLDNQMLKEIKRRDDIHFPFVVTFQLTDQSAINYIFRNNFKIVSPIYDNMTRFVDAVGYKEWIANSYNFKDFDQFFDKSVIYHLHEPKPWWSVSKDDTNIYSLKALEKYKNIEKEMWKALNNHD